MKKISINGGKVVVLFNPNFYSAESIREAADNYNDVFRAKIRRSGNEISVELKPRHNNEKIEKIADEFCNNVLLIMKNRAEV